MRPDGSHLRNLTSTPKFDEHSARVSPDGKKVLYRRVTKGKRNSVSKGLPQDVATVALRSWPQNGTLVIANSDGSDPRPLGDDGAFAWATWGPEGKRIACLEQAQPEEAAPPKPTAAAGKQNASFQIVIREADTLNVVTTLPSAGIHSQAVWSLDGKRICGSANLPPGKGRSGKEFEYPFGVGKIASVDIESGRRTAMTLFPDWYPVWATDGTGDWFQGGSPSVLHSANTTESARRTTRCSGVPVLREQHPNWSSVNSRSMCGAAALRPTTSTRSSSLVARPFRCTERWRSSDSPTLRSREAVHRCSTKCWRIISRT
jgi:hypothetical protein